MVQNDKLAFHDNRLISASIHIKIKRSKTVIFQSKVWVSIKPQILDYKINLQITDLVKGIVNCHSSIKFQNTHSSYGNRKLQILFPYYTNIPGIKLSV